MIEYRQMDTNTLFEGELTMKLKGRVLALTMALMLIITSMSGFALAESVSISVNATANADGTTNVSASFSGFPANAGNATTVMEGGGNTSNHQNLKVDADGTSAFGPKDMPLAAGSYTIKAYLDGVECGSASFEVKGAPAGDSSEPKEEENNEPSSDEGEQGNENESEGGQTPSDAENGATLMSTESQNVETRNADEYDPQIDTRTRIEDGKLLIDVKITGLPEKVAVINTSVNNGSGTGPVADPEIKDGMYGVTLTASAVTPGAYKVTSYIKLENAEQEEADYALRDTITFVPVAPTLVSEPAYTQGASYTLIWESDVTYEGADIAYEVSYWGLPVDAEEEDWIAIQSATDTKLYLSSSDLAKYGTKYSVRAIARVGEETFEGDRLEVTLTATDAPEVGIDVADVALNSEGSATVTAIVTVPEGATIDYVRIYSKDAAWYDTLTAAEGEPSKYTYAIYQAGDYYIEAKVNGVVSQQAFKVTEYVHPVTVNVVADADNITATFENLPEGVQQVCINVQDAAGNKQKEYFAVEEGNASFITTDEAVNALLKTPGKYTIIASYQGSDDEWYYPETTNNLRIEVKLEAPQVDESGTYTPGEDYTLTWDYNTDQYAEGVEITYAIGILKDDADGTEDSDWDKVASDLTETSYTIPASYFESTGQHTFGVRALCGGEMSEIARITLTNEGSPRFVKAPETLLYPDENGKYTLSAEIEGVDVDSITIASLPDAKFEPAQFKAENGTVKIETTFSIESINGSTFSAIQVLFTADGEEIKALTTSIQIAPAVPAITSGTEIEHKAGEALTITWGEVTGATDYIVKIDGKEHSTITGTDITIPGSYFEDGKSYAITIEARKGSGETAVVGKPATVNVAVGTQPLAEGTFTVEEALLDSNGTATVRISASNLDPRVVSIRMTHGATTQLFTDLSQPMELTIPNVESNEISLVVVQNTADPSVVRATSLDVALVIESSLPRYTLSTDEVSMSAEGAKFELVIYNLPEDAQRLAVNLSGEKNDNIQVTDALRDANGNITLEIGSTAYPFKALSQPGEHTVRVTYQDGAGAWPQIGEVGSLTVKPATPVLSSSEDTISSGDGYTLTFTDDVKNEYGVTYEYAFQDEATGAYGAWTQTAEKTVTIPAASLPDAETFTIGVRAQSGGVYSDIATVRVSIKSLTVTITPEVVPYSGKDETVSVTVDGIGQAHRGETADLFFNTLSTSLASGTISENGSVTLSWETGVSMGSYPFEVRVGDEVIAKGDITVGPAAPAIISDDPLNIAAPATTTISFTTVEGAEGYRLQMTGGGKTITIATPSSSAIGTIVIASSNFANNTTYSVAVSAYATVNGVRVYGPADTMTIIVGESSGGDDPSGGEMVSGDYKFTVSGRTATITGYTGSASNISLPQMLNGYMVTTIGDGAFQGNKTITSVYIPDSIVTIGANAFEGSDLLQVSGMQKVTSMGAYAFANTDLTAFTIPSGLVALPEGALMNTRITGIVIPTTLTSIGAKAFAGCTQLANYAGAAGKGTSYRLASIGSGAFSGCTKLTSLYIPSSVTSISSDFVDGCTNLAAFEVHGSNPNFLDFNGVLFSRSYSTTLLRFPPAMNMSSLDLSDFKADNGKVTIVSIASGAFANSRYLKSVTLPSTITSISANAFLNSSITSISIPTTVTSIGTSAFQGSNLTSVIIPSSVKTISNRAFQSCKNLTSVTINSGATSINPYAFYNCTSLTKVSIPTTVTYIGDYAFANCSSLEDITIPDSVTTIATGAFKDANKNLRIRCVENSAAHVYAKENGINVYLEDFVPRLSTDLLTNQSLLATYRAGAGGTFNLSSNTNWTIDTTDAWLTVYNRTADPTGANAARTITGSGNASIGIMVTQNTGTTARQSSLKILWKDANNLQQLITVNVYQEPRSEALDSQIVVNAGAPYRQTSQLGINYLYNIPAGTTAQTLTLNLNDGLGRFQVTDRNGASVAATATVQTGYTITMLDDSGSDIETAVLSVAGDVNRDGRISVSDINLAIDIFLGSTTRAEQELAADVNLDGKLSVSDVNAIIDLYLG